MIEHHDCFKMNFCLQFGSPPCSLIPCQSQWVFSIYLFTSASLNVSELFGIWATHSRLALFPYTLITMCDHIAQVLTTNNNIIMCDVHVFVICTYVFIYLFTVAQKMLDTILKCHCPWRWLIIVLCFCFVATRVRLLWRFFTILAC